MSLERLALLVEAGRDGAAALKSPKIGTWSDPPDRGALLGPGSAAGVLTQLARRYALVVPDGVAGRVESERPHERVFAVVYGEVLFRVAPVGTVGAAAPPAASARSRGAKAVVAPTDGVFYGAPSPGAPPFVTPGQRVVAGQTVGLIEVMKTFNPIVFGGASLPAEAEVVEILVEDGREVRGGDPLVVVR